MNLFFKNYPANDHAKYCIHHEHCNHCVNQQKATYRLRDCYDSNNNSCNYDCNRKLLCSMFGTSPHFTFPRKISIMKYIHPETRIKKANKHKKSARYIKVKPYPKGVISMHYSLKTFSYLGFLESLRGFLCKS